MSRQVPCSRGEALARANVAERYLTVADLAAEDDADTAHNVAVGNAVLAGIAASDALCCLRLFMCGGLRRKRSTAWRFAVRCQLPICASRALKSPSANGVGARWH